VLADEILSLGGSHVSLPLFRSDRFLPELDTVSLNHLLPHPEFKSPLRFDYEDSGLFKLAVLEVEPIVLN